MMDFKKATEILDDIKGRMQACKNDTEVYAIYDNEFMGFYRGVNKVGQYMTKHPEHYTGTDIVDVLTVNKKANTVYSLLDGYFKNKGFK